MRKIIAYVLIIAAILGNYMTVKAEESTDLNLASPSAILVDASSGEVIYEKNADEKLRPASVTKIMTLLLIFEELDSGRMNYEDIVTVTAHSASMGGSQCFFEAGEQQTVKDMIKCIEVASGNDAAVAMAEHICGSEEAFVKRMNERAAELGMKNTHFENACGLEAEGHVTTARDISIMSRELISKHKGIYDFSTIWMDSIIHKTKKRESRFDLANTNKFLNMYTGATGLKTGYTSQAKYCMSATANRDGIELVAVIMGAETKEIRNSEACMLLDYGYARCRLYVDTEVLPLTMDIPVAGGVKKEAGYKPIGANSFVLINRNVELVKKDVIIYNNIKAPVYEGDIIGTVQYTYEGEIVNEIFIYAAEDIKKMSFGYSIGDVFKRLFMLE